MESFDRAMLTGAAGTMNSDLATASLTCVAVRLVRRDNVFLGIARHRKVRQGLTDPDGVTVREENCGC